MYHKVGQPVQQKEDTFLNVSCLHFRAQMRLLKWFGYEARTFAQIVDAWKKNTPLPPKTCVITFDDAYLNVWENAYPTLHELGMTATLFVVTGAIGGENTWDRPCERRILPLMNEDQLRHAQAEGWELASHTHTHPHLDQLDTASALEEIRKGKEELEQRFHTSVTTFCYPYGHLNQETPDLVRQAGFQGACTTQSGIATASTPPFLLPRIKVSYSDKYIGFLYRLLLNHRLPEIRNKRRSSLKNTTTQPTN
jgi:peptidoglycan/xylan/chitin deacetylase (PgdA/CDA1 family)